uniref:Uncharacterized protein n=1 Tax=Magallana gigas TaxID=29159 RepID=K1Q8B2_MAGGI
MDIIGMILRRSSTSSEQGHSVRDHDDGLSGVNTPPQSGKVKLQGVVRDFSERFTVK